MISQSHIAIVPNSDVRTRTGTPSLLKLPQPPVRLPHHLGKDHRVGFGQRRPQRERVPQLGLLGEQLAQAACLADKARIVGRGEVQRREVRLGHGHQLPCPMGGVPESFAVRLGCAAEAAVRSRLEMEAVESLQLAAPGERPVPPTRNKRDDLSLC